MLSTCFSASSTEAAEMQTQSLMQRRTAAAAQCRATRPVRVAPRGHQHSHVHRLRAQAAPAVEQTLPADIKSVLFNEQVLQEKVAELGSQIGKEYEGRQLVVLGVLNGAFIFTSDLVRHISAHIPDVKVDFVRANSYGQASESAGAVQVAGMSRLSRWSDFHVLLVEDIIDSGHTLDRLARDLRAVGAASVKVCALLDKKGRRRVEFHPDFVGFDCPNEFVVGYGLDFNERFRCLPYVAALEESAYS